MSDVRIDAGLAAIKDAFERDSSNYDSSVLLFAADQIHSLSEENLKAATGDPEPDHRTILGALIFDKEWTDKKTGYTRMDYTLPVDATTDVLSIEYDKKGNLVDILFES